MDVLSSTVVMTEMFDIGCIGSATIGLNIYNLLGTRYYRSGMNTNLLPQQGRWFLVSLGIKI